MKKSRIFMLIGAYLAVVAAALIAVNCIDRTLEKRIPAIYKELGQKGTESVSSGKYGISLDSFDYLKKSGTAYMVWKVSAADGKRAEMAEGDSELVPGILLKMMPGGMIKVTKRVYQGSELVLCIFAQLNEPDTYDSIDFILNDGKNDIDGFTLSQSTYDGESFTADTIGMGRIDFTSYGIVINYKEKAPEIEKLSFQRKLNSDFQITNNEVIDTIYDTGNELVIILRKKLDFNGVEKLTANAEQVELRKL